jgi:hypothetical protein
VRAQLDDMLKPVLARMAKYPERALRETALTAVAARWEALPSEFRLAFFTDIDRRGRTGMFTDIRALPTSLGASLHRKITAGCGDMPSQQYRSDPC